MLLVGFAGVGVLISSSYIAITSGRERATSAADATAHASAGFLAAYAQRDDLSIEAQAGRAACELDVTTPGADGMDSPLCGPVLDVARSVADDNGARLENFVVSADPRDYVDGKGPGRLLVLVRVALPQKLPLSVAGCGTSHENTLLCFARAWGSAEEVG